MTGTVQHILDRDSKMIVVDTRIDDVYRDRDFGRVEAQVTLFVKRRGAPLRPVRVHANVPARGGDLRGRLIADAHRLIDHVTSRPIQIGHGRAA